MSNGYTPRHNPQRAERLANHVSLWRRVPSWRRLPQWVGVAGLLAGLLIAGGEHTAHLLADEPTQEHSHAAEPAPAPSPEVVVEYSMSQACADALDAATKGFDVASGHVSDMHDHIRDTGAATRDHLPGMADSVNKIEKLRDRLDDAAKSCEEAES